MGTAETMVPVFSTVFKSARIWVRLELICAVACCSRAAKATGSVAAGVAGVVAGVFAPAVVEGAAGAGEVGIMDLATAPSAVW